jgi:histidine ammonia-lyase
MICKEALEKIKLSSSYVDEIVNQRKIVYGINTGFGPLCDTLISSEDTTKLQHNLLKSHSVGVGELISAELSKLMLILKLHALCQGFSGIREETIQRIHWMIENDICPAVPSQGSVGASGDLAPLAHLFLPLIGLGKILKNKSVDKNLNSSNTIETIETAQVLKEHNAEPLELGPKEGLALINGTQFIAAHSIIALARFHNALDAADVIGAMTLEGYMGSSKPFDSRLHGIRPFPGNQYVASRFENILESSEIRDSHQSCERVQDPYSLRCMPQVHGASRTAWLHLKELTEIEINSVTDNPVILGSFDTISGGNFHGQPLAMALDYVSVAAAELGNISDRRSYLIIEGKYGLPKLLIQDAGLNSGFMIPQYTSAALVSENKSNCFPASADSIPTSLGQEDHVSMGSISGRKLNSIINNLEYILAIELLYASQAIDFRRPLRSSPIIEDCHALVREHVEFANEDRIFSEDMNKLHSLIKSGSFAKRAEESAKKNHHLLNDKLYESFRIS